jgi:hypothetical protein
MRTKTLLLAAVLSAAGIASSQAQVYSVNVVGYINLTNYPGLNLITAQLKGTNQNVNTILGSTTPALPANSLLFTWNGAGQRFDNALLAGGDNKWYDPATGLESTATISPGQSFFINNVGTANVIMTLVGEVPTGATAVSVVNGLGFYGDPAPVSQNIVTNGFPVGDNDLLYTWNVTGQTYNNALIGGGPASGGPGWFDAGTGLLTVFAPAVGQGFVVNRTSGATTTWNRTFTVQ